MGHKIAYGSAIVPPEFETENAIEPSYAASRSWSFPLFFAVIMKTMSFFNFDYHTVILPTIRIILAVNATFLIYSSRKLARQITNDQNVELFTTVFVAMWFRLAELSVRSFNNTFFLPILFFAIYRILVNLETNKINNIDHFLVIFGIGLSTYNRLDLILIIFGFFMFSFNLSHLKLYIEYTIDALVGWSVGLIIDNYFYETESIFKMKIPPRNWFIFNLIENNSDYFGLSTWDYYFYELIVLDGLLVFVIFNLFVLWIILLLIYTNRRRIYHENKFIVRSYFKQFGISCFIWLVYSNFWRGLSVEGLMSFLLSGKSWEPMSHKELRFIMGGLLVLLIFIATGFQIGIILLVNFIKWISFDGKKIRMTKISKPRIESWINIIITTFIIVLIVTQSISRANDRQYVEDFADLNRALMYVGYQTDVSGVIIGVNSANSPYTYLHLNADIPIFHFNLLGVEPSKYDVTKNFLDSSIKLLEFNYFVAPDYQFQMYPELSSVLLVNNWILIKLYEGKVDVWTRL